MRIANNKVIFVDAACSGNPGIMEYQAIDWANGKQIIHAGPFPYATNNIGEFLAIVDTLKRIRQKKSDKVIYSDSQTAISWITSGKIKTTLPYNQQTATIMKKLEEAKVRLHTHAYTTPIHKRETAIRWEIPADFNRK